MAGFGRKVIDAGFQKPTGLVGRLGGRLMASGNGATEQHIAALADCAPRETVLVVGCGPGVGVRPLLEASAEVVAVDPSPVMLEATVRRCRDLLESGRRLTIRNGTAEEHGAPAGSADVAISVNNVMIWPDRRAGLASILTALRPGGRFLVSAHQKWLPDGLAEDCEAVGFASVEEWTWEPPGRGASTAVQLRAVHPGA